MGYFVAAIPTERRAAIAGALVALVSIVAPSGNTAQAAEETGSPLSPSCTTLARVPGPEDLVLEEERHRLLVSSQDRRSTEDPDGAIWAVPLDPAHSAYPLVLSGRRDECSFHPHGIDLVLSCEGQRLLYVLNHHEPEDRHPERGCFAAGELRSAPKDRLASVEVYVVEDRRLRFLQRLTDPEVLAHGNDLVALPNGDVWVTDPPAGKLAQALEVWGWSHRSRVVHFRCAQRRDGRCVGRWETRTDPAVREERIRFANGIAYRPLPDSDACEGNASGVLYVAGGAERTLHRFRVHDGRCLETLKPLRFPDSPDRPNPDNLTWIGDQHTRLLVAGHPNLRRFLQHSRSRDVPSPSAVAEVRVGSESLGVMPVFHDPGGLISAASVAACVDGDLVLGQVFESAVLRCVLETPCDGTASR